jgi:hypothetical protein
MKPALVFVHGINVGPDERAGLVDWLERRATTFGVRDAFGVIHAARWPSRGSFMIDLAELGAHGTTRAAAVGSIVRDLSPIFYGGGPVLVVAHSMGQPLAVAALTFTAKRDHGRVALLTVGGPMGCVAFRPYFNWLPSEVWIAPPQDRLGLREWVDVHSHDDPINGGAEFYRPSPAWRAVEMNAPARFNPLMPLREHGAYFDLARFWALAAEMAARLEAP